jgi:enterochelin esterase-like enzyme
MTPSLAGELVTESFAYDGGREVTVYVPPNPAQSIVFAADGGWHTTRLAEALEAAGERSTMIVGVHGLADDEARLKEYSPGFDAERFAGHERFFVEDVGGWVRSRFGLSLPPDRTAVWGASAGGELSLAMGVRHPDLFGAVFCSSPGGGYRPPEPLPATLPRFYLLGGRQEPWFLENAARWADALRAADIDVVLEERDGEHGGAFWIEELPLMVAWAFGGGSPQDSDRSTATSG